MPVNLNKYKEEVESGLHNESKLMDKALERQRFYDYEGKMYQKYFKRNAESWEDWHERSHRQSGFLREAVSKLCSHLYSPGPGRLWSDKTGDDFLQQVYRENLIDSFMLECDKLSTLNAVVAIQIDAGNPANGKDEDGNALSDENNKPITYRMWSREHFCVFTDPDDDRVVEAVVTVDMYNAQKRFRLWSDTEVWTFLTKSQDPGVGGGLPTEGGTAAHFEKAEDHEYGCLPFTFIHYELPLKCFDVVAPGEFLQKAEIAIDNRLMQTDESIIDHMNPIPWATGVEPNWKPIVGPLRFVRLPKQQGHFDGESYIPGEPAQIGLLQFQIDVAGCWEDLEKFVRQALEAVGIPQSDVHMEQMTVESGISLLIRAEPLINRAENRHTAFRVYEKDLGQRTLMCAGNHYGKTELLESAKGDIKLNWPEPGLTVLTKDMLEIETEKVQKGLMSFLELLMRVRKCSRDEALEIIKQLKKDREDVEAIDPSLVAATAPEDPAATADADHQRALEVIAAKEGAKDA